MSHQGLGASLPIHVLPGPGGPPPYPCLTRAWGPHSLSMSYQGLGAYPCLTRAWGAPSLSMSYQGLGASLPLYVLPGPGGLTPYPCLTRAWGAPPSPCLTRAWGAPSLSMSYQGLGGGAGCSLSATVADSLATLIPAEGGSRERRPAAPRGHSEVPATSPAQWRVKYGSLVMEGNVYDLVGLAERAV